MDDEHIPNAIDSRGASRQDSSTSNLSAVPAKRLTYGGGLDSVRPQSVDQKDCTHHKAPEDKCGQHERESNSESYG